MGIPSWPTLLRPSTRQDARRSVYVSLRGQFAKGSTVPLDITGDCDLYGYYTQYIYIVQGIKRPVEAPQRRQEPRVAG